MSYACPSCGTDYARKLAQLETLPAKVRCHRCGTVWQPTSPSPEPRRRVEALPEPEPAAAPASVPPPPAPPPAPAARRSRLGPALWALALLLLAGGLGGVGYAYRDVLPWFAGPAPVLTEVQPAWTEVNGQLRLLVDATIANEGKRPAVIEAVRVKFLSAQRAWIGEAMVAVPPIAVAAGEAAPIDFTVDRVPDGAAALEFVLVPSRQAPP